MKKDTLQILAKMIQQSPNLGMQVESYGKLFATTTHGIMHTLLRLHTTLVGLKQAKF